MEHVANHTITRGQMGDVEQEVYEDFLSKLDHEIDYEN